MITDPTIRKKLVEMGYDPDEAEEVSDQQNPTSSMPIKVVEKPSFFGSAGREASRSVLPSVAAIAAGAATMPLTPFVSIPVAAATGYLTRRLQDEAIKELAPKRLSESYEESAAIDRLTQPLASTIGGIASAGPFLAPQLKAFPALGRAIFSKAPISSVDKQVLMNAGIGAAIPVGIRSAVDPNVTIPELLSEGLGGSLMSRPTVLGQKLGLTVPTQPVRPEPIVKPKVEETQPLSTQVRERQPIDIEAEVIPSARNDLLRLTDTQLPTVIEPPAPSVALAARNVPTSEQGLTIPPPTEPPIIAPPPDSGLSRDPLAPKFKRAVNLGPFRPEIDKIYAMGTPVAKDIAINATKFYDKYNTFYGGFVNNFTSSLRNLTGLATPIGQLRQPLNALQRNTPEMDNVLTWFDDMRDGVNNPIKLTPNEEQIKYLVQDTMAEVRDGHLARPIIETPGERNPNYLPEVPSNEMIETLRNNPESPESKVILAKLYKYQVDKGLSPDIAKENTQNFVNGWTQNNPNLAKQFGPIDKAAGVGIPREYREKNLEIRVNKYLNRVARRFAYADTFELKPELEAAIPGMSGNESIKTVMQDIQGTGFGDDEPLIMALQGTIRSGVLGTLTGAKDLGTSQLLGISHAENTIQHGRAVLNSWTNLRDNIRDSFSAGRNRFHLNSLEWNQGLDDTVNLLRRTREILTSAQARNFLEKLSRASVFGQGRFIAIDNMNKVARGDISPQTRAFFERFAYDIPWQLGNVTHRDVETMAARYTDDVQGTYDYRGLPRQAVKGQLSPILSLARWSIEKSNRFIKNVVNPALNGNYKPAINTTIGTLIGGAAVNELVEQLTGRKNKASTVKELQVGKEMGQDVKAATAYKLMGLVTASSQTGMLGDLVNSLVEVTYGKNRAQWYDNLLLETAGDVSASVFNLIKTALNGELTTDAVLGTISDVIESNLQAYRLALGYLSAEKKEDIDKVNKLRDLRVFNMQEGNDVRDLSLNFNRPIRTDTWKFKNSDTVAEAAELLPELVLKAFKDSKGDVSDFADALENLKSGSQYTTMPNIDKKADDFVKFTEFLAKTQGKEEAKARIVDYFSKKALAEERRELVP